MDRNSAVSVQYQDIFQATIPFNLIHNVMSRNSAVRKAKLSQVTSNILLYNDNLVVHFDNPTQGKEVSVLDWKPQGKLALDHGTSSFCKVSGVQKLVNIWYYVVHFGGLSNIKIK